MNTPAFIDRVNNIIVRITLTDKLFFTKNLGLMVRSGIALSEGLNSLAAQTENKKFRAVLTDVAARVQKGESLSDSLGNHKAVFPEIFLNMISAGEESGNLENVLKTLTNQMHKEHDLHSKVKGALAYPIVVFTAMIGITSGLVIFVVPKLTAMFSESGMVLPLPTRILVGISNALIDYSYIIAASILWVIFLFLRARKSQTGKRILHTITLRAPIIGRLAVKVNIARFARSLASLLKTDIPVVQSFQITASVLGNIYYRKALEETAEKLKTGANIHETLSEHANLFSPTIIQMVSVGEETGKLDEILEELAVFYEEDLDTTLKNLPAILEPILILFLGGTVGGIAIAIMLPIFSLSQVGGGA